MTRDWRRALASMAVLAPLAGVQLWLFGSLSSYPNGSAEFSLRFLTDRPWYELAGHLSHYRNFELYPQLLMGRWGWIVPGLPLFAGYELWRRRREPAARLAVAVVLGNLLLYSAYFFQSYRFMLPAATIVVVYAAVGCVEIVRRFGGRTTGRPWAAGDGSEGDERSRVQATSRV